MTARLGLIGAGRWGTAYIKTLSAMEDIRLVRVASRSAATAALVPSGCGVTADWREVATARDLDGVIIATPPRLHYEIAEAAIRAGLAVLVEKPLTLTLADAERLREMAVSGGRCVFVGHVHLYSPAFEELRRRVRPPIVAIRGIAGGWGPFREDVSVLWDWGPHDIAMSVELLGRPLHAAATMTRQAAGPAGTATGEVVRMTLDFADSVQAIFTLSNVATLRRRVFTVSFGDAEEAEYEDHDGHRLRASSAGALRDIPVDPTRPLDRMLSAFVAAIGEPVPSFREIDLGVEVVRVLEECDRDPRAARRA